jgi:hypothetical protein
MTDHSQDLLAVVVTPSIMECAIPLLASSLSVGTILTVYFVTKLPPGIHTPPISLLGCRQPEHFLYQVGFSSFGLLFGYSVVVLFRKHFYEPIREFSGMIALGSWIGGILAVVGVIGQGLITLHQDFLENIQPGGIGMTQQDIWHQQLASVFFLGAAIHSYATCFYAYRSNPSTKLTTTTTTSSSTPATDNGPSHRIFSTISCRIKIICVVLSLLAAPIAETYHPTRLVDTNADDTVSERIFNVIGLTQYVAVGAYTVFFGSYTLDLYTLRQHLLQKEQLGMDKKYD